MTSIIAKASAISTSRAQRFSPLVEDNVMFSFQMLWGYQEDRNHFSNERLE